MLSRDLAIPSLFSSGRFGGWGDLSLPHSSIQQTDSAVNVELAVPGFTPEEVHITVDGNLLKVKARHESNQSNEEKDSTGKVIGRSKQWSSSDIYESFRLPSGLSLNEMTKNVSDGMLRLSIPKLAITDKQQQQRQQQQALSWPPQVQTTEAPDGKHVTYTIPLEGALKENVRINIENSNLYLTVLEHGQGHSFANCGTCSASEKQQPQQPLSWSYTDEQRLREEKDRRISRQCNKFSERSCVIRLPYGTTADCVDAKFEAGQLIVNVEKKQHWGPVIIH